MRRPPTPFWWSRNLFASRKARDFGQAAANGLPEDFRFVQTTTQRFAFPEAVDLAIACQSLFYIPPEELSGVIERVWNALRPGGLFVVNEHIER
ncbi:MAG: class I SAM-dependent methyltransferase [Rhizomicrobium sp.]